MHHQLEPNFESLNQVATSRIQESNFESLNSFLNLRFDLEFSTSPYSTIQLGILNFTWFETSNPVSNQVDLWIPYSQSGCVGPLVGGPQKRRKLNEKFEVILWEKLGTCLCFFSACQEKPYFINSLVCVKCQSSYNKLQLVLSDSSSPANSAVFIK